MTQTTDKQSVTVPSQEQLDGLLREAQRIADEIASTLGCERGGVVISVHDTPHDLFEALPHKSIRAGTPNEDGTVCVWKQVARGGRYSASRIDVNCVDSHRCPDWQAQP